MNESILTTIKKRLGIEEEDTSFDNDVIMEINTVFMILNQLGVGPELPFVITDKSSTWSDFDDNINTIRSVESYIYIRVRLMFDPPSNSFVVDAMNQTAKEIEWRLNIVSDHPAIEG